MRFTHIEYNTYLRIENVYTKKCIMIVDKNKYINRSKILKNELIVEVSRICYIIRNTISNMIDKIMRVKDAW